MTGRRRRAGPAPVATIGRAAVVVVIIMVGLAAVVPGCADEAANSGGERRPDESSSMSTSGRNTTVPTTAQGDEGAPPTTTTTAEPAAPPSRNEVPAGRDVVITSITDGDTFRAGDERVRLIGIDTPEVSGDVECFGREATAALDRLVPPGTDVRLVADVGLIDRYGRTLAYVYRLDDGTFINLAMARGGYAVPLTVPPDVAHSEALAEAAADARDAGRGLWSACGDGVDPGPPPPSPPPTTAAPEVTPTTEPSGADPKGEDCDPAYPDACIPPAPPDLDCGDVALRDFTVLAPDPHHFDGGGDGRGCEPP